LRKEGQLTQLSTLFAPFQSTLFDSIRGFFLQKNSQFFSATFIGNHLEILQKPPKKTFKTMQKTRVFAQKNR